MADEVQIDEKETGSWLSVIFWSFSDFPTLPFQAAIITIVNRNHIELFLVVNKHISNTETKI